MTYVSKILLLEGWVVFLLESMFPPTFEEFLALYIVIFCKYNILGRAAKSRATKLRTSED